MGTRNSFQYKIEVASAIISQASKERINIDKERLTSMIMLECFCERRKARELISALLIRFPEYSETKTELIYNERQGDRSADNPGDYAGIEN